VEPSDLERLEVEKLGRHLRVPVLVRWSRSGERMWTSEDRVRFVGRGHDHFASDS